MTACKIPADLYLAEATLEDPGDAKTISVNKSLATCNLVSAGAETRTLGRPLRSGVLISLHMKTDGGDITLTVTGGYDEAGSTTYVFSAASQFLILASFFDGTNYYWRKVADHVSGNASGQSFTNASFAGTTTFADEANVAANATTGTKIGTANSQKIGFWNATPIIQPSGTGELIGILGFADNSANATNMNSNGNTGTKRYSFNDVVKALKNAGILATS